MDGTHTVEFTSTDRAGNVEAVHTVMISMDTTAPVTTAVLGGTTGGNGWYSTTVSVTLTTMDATSGVATREIQIDGGGFQPYTGSVPIASEGSHDVEFRSVDAAGNAEAVQVVPFQIDRTPPTSTKSYSGTQGGGGWYTSSVSVLLSGSDALSGLAGIAYRLDGGAWTPYAGAYVVIEES